jgi:hypothetical protein
MFAVFQGIGTYTRDAYINLGRELEKDMRRNLRRIGSFMGRINTLFRNIC